MVCDPWPPDLGDNREWWGPWENQRAQALLKERTAIQLQTIASFSGQCCQIFCIKNKWQIKIFVQSFNF